MKLNRETLIAGAAIAALLLWARKSQAHGIDVTFPPGDQWYPAPEDWQPSADYFDPVYDAPDDGVEYQTAESIVEYPAEEVPATVDWFHGAGSMNDILNRNVNALLDAIIWAEHYPVDVISGDAYRTYYGGSKFTDMSDHPVITGEKSRVALPERFCRAAGYSGSCYSTAAGAFQMTVPTWLDFRSRGTYLRDFTPESQREAARRMLNAIGATRALLNGDFAGAVQRASKRWASLPGSTARQGGKSLAFVKQKFLDAGGTFT